MSEANGSPKIGLLTPDALRQLKYDINSELQLFKSKQNARSWSLRALQPSNRNALVTWPTLGVAVLCCVGLHLAQALGGSGGAALMLQAVLLWSAIGLNLWLVYNEDRLSRDEIPRRIKHSLVELEQAAQDCNWEEKHYPHLCAPCSPCVTLQWTYRDGKVVNLPWALLVRGDTVVMRPGQEAPARCQALRQPGPVLLPRQIYQPSSVGKEVSGAPRATQPHKSKLFTLTETPYVSNLKLALQPALSRPVTVHNKQRHLVIIKCIETFVLPAVILVIVVALIIRHFHLGGGGAVPWGSAVLQPTVAALVPLVPTLFPAVWTALNIYGMAKFKNLLQSSTKYISTKPGSVSEENPLLKAGGEHGPFHKSLWRTFFNILVGRENFVARSANIVQVLGSVTALCCVDKKGILSWPNPTAEKVFFLRNSTSISRSSSKTSFMGSAGHLSNDRDAKDAKETKDTKDIKDIKDSKDMDPPRQQHGSQGTLPHLCPTTIAEVLDLTHDQNVPFGLEFDDHSWKKYISCLKPLGLAILLNTCNMDTQEHYSHFCAHLTCEATQSEDVVPVTNRRCLCELAKQIGFMEEAKNAFTLQDHLATFRHLQPEVIRRDTRFARSLHLSTRVKVPLPHMLGVIIRDQAGGLQLMTQGTADIILDSCVEYWNGQELCVLSPSDRKKVQDFYQRSSLTAYCSAFAYRPLRQGVSPQLASTYLELPADCRALYPAVPAWNEAPISLAAHHQSTDSLLYNEMKDDDVMDAEGCFDLQCNQVFIGMVTMQYQAQSDMVELIERLDRACVRFVHFSKENELRSRVFSERMGLESGWNCHISLASETDRPSSPTTSQNLASPSCSRWPGPGSGAQGDAAPTGDPPPPECCAVLHSSLESSKALSSSAPGAINLDHTTVKFDNEASRVRYEASNDSAPSLNNEEQEEVLQRVESQDSVLLGGWEEADSSPPDGCRSISCLTDSTDHSAPVNFDMRNRAKLPRGIDNIRPHIEQVDNVPLLVSLFTDCTASTARRMIAIMQDYNEVVCVMGSAANKDNMEIFMQADASVAVEPLYPVLCQKVPPYELPARGVGPVDLARLLNSIPCSISMVRDDDLSLLSLVTMARHFMLCLWSSAQFWLSATCSLTLLQVACIIMCLPMILSVGDVMWLSMAVVPLISVALVCSPVDPEVMTKATDKQQGVINFKVSMFVIWCYGCRFLPAIVIVLVSYATMLRSFCQQIVDAGNSTDCLLVYPRPVSIGLESNGSEGVLLEQIATNRHWEGLEWQGWSDTHAQGHLLAQHTAFLITTLMLVTISISFVHRDHSIWQKNLATNRVWVTFVLVLLVAQSLYSSLVLFLPPTDPPHFRLPLPHLIVIVAAPFVVLAINELIKWQEIKANVRYQRRARLDFGTKLGMNSPF